jgi:hypothetical protein
MKSCIRTSFGTFLFASILTAASVQAQGTAFTYQGKLDVGGNPANGSYDLAFQLFNAASNGVAGPAVTNLDTSVSNGLFTVLLDFGGGVFPGSNNWVQISARTNGGATFTNLTPLLPLTPTPYALAAGTASNALTATTATSLSGTIGSVNLSGTYTNAVTFNNTNNVFVGNGAGLTGVVAASLSTNYSIANGSPLQLTNAGNVFVGSGAGLTNLSASSLAGGPWSNALVAGLTNLGAYFQTNSSGASASINTNAHLTLADQTGTIVESKGGGVFEILMTNGNAFVFSNGSLTIQSNGSGLQYSSGSLAISSNLTVSGVISGNGGGLTNVPVPPVTGLYTNAVNFSNAGNIFTGDGAGLSNVAVASGGLSGVYSNTVTFINTNNLFIGEGSGLSNVTAVTLSGNIVPLTLTNPGNVIVGDGSGLSNVTATVLSGVVAVDLTNRNNLFVGSGSGLSNVTASAFTGTVSNASLTGAYTGAVTISNAADAFVGDGSGLINLNASNITSGIVPLTAENPAVLTNSEAAAVTLTTNLAVGGNLAVSGIISGNGSALTNLALAATYTNAITISNSADAFAGDGSGLTNLVGTPLYGGVNLTFPSPGFIFCPLTGEGTNFVTASAVATNIYYAIAPRNEVISHLTFSSSVPFGATTNYIFYLLTNGSLTSLSATITGDGATQVASNFTNVVNVAAGTQEMIEIVGTIGSGGPVYFNWSMLVK